MSGTFGNLGGGSSASANQDAEYVVLCDVVAATGVSTPFLRHFVRNAAGVVTIKDTALDGTTAYTVAGVVRLCDAPVLLTTEVYRLSGAATGTSTASTGPASTPVTGNTLTIAPPFRSLAWQWLRSSPQDPGDGNTARVEVNGLAFHSGSGPVYATSGQTIASSTGQQFNSSWKFDAFGQAAIEVIVIR